MKSLELERVFAECAFFSQEDIKTSWAKEKLAYKIRRANKVLTELGISDGKEFSLRELGNLSVVLGRYGHDPNYVAKVVMTRYATLGEFQVGVLEGAINMMAPAVIMSASPLLMMVYFAMKKLVERIRNAMVAEHKQEVREEELNLTERELFQI